MRAGPSSVSCGHRLDSAASRTTCGQLGIDVGQYHFTDLTYADDTAIFMSDRSQATNILQTFNSMAASLGLKIGPRRSFKILVQATHPARFH